MNIQSKKIIASIYEVEGIADLIKTYQQIAAQRMVELQKKITNTKDYFDGLSKVSNEVGIDIDTVDKRKIKAFLLLTADSRMYGDLLDRVFMKFLQEIKLNPTIEVYVMGKIGVQMLKTVVPNKKFQEVNQELIKNIIKTRSLKIFHGEYKNLAYQEISTSSIDDLPDVSSEKLNNGSASTKYFYEPSLNAVSSVFRNNITASLIWFTMSKSEMALSAARVIHLEKSIANTETSLSKLHKSLFSTNRKFLQRKMIHRYQVSRMKK